MSHQNLVGLCGFTMKPFCLVTEFVSEGSLHDFLHDEEKSAKLDWPLRLRIAHDLGNAIKLLFNVLTIFLQRRDARSAV